MRAAWILGLLGTVSVLLVVSSSAASTTLAVGCAHWAAPGGDDAGLGSASSPYGTVAHLLLTLRPGQRGCLEPGAVFDEHVVVSASGRAGAPIVLMSTPNQQGAVLQGGVEFGPSVHDVVIEHVAVRTTATAQLQALVILRGLRNELIDSNVQGAAAAPGSEACVLLDHANRVVVDHDAIEQCGHLASPQGYVPGVLDSVSSGARITNNVIRQNPSDGIALAPDAQLSVVSRNLIINNGGGVFFGGGTSFASSNNHVTHNVIANSATFNVHATYASGAPTGKKNIVSANCISGAGQANVAGLLPGGRGFKTAGNVVASPAAKACKANEPSASSAVTSSPKPTKRAVRLVSASGITLDAPVAVAGNHVKLIGLTVHGTVAGASISLVCISGCTEHESLRASLSGSAISKAFAGKTLAEGAVIEARATKSGYVGAWRRFLLRPDVAAGVVFHIQETGCLRGSAKIACPKPGK